MKVSTSRCLFALSLSLVLPAAPAAAQGSPVHVVSEEVHHYLSPMVLELDLNEFTESVPDKTWTTQATKRLVCRGVTIESISFTVFRSSEDALVLRILAIVTNSTGKDKLVRMDFANAEQGKERLMGAVVQKINPDERKNGTNLLYVLPSDPWRHRPRSIVRLTVTADDY
jgi:hypothetical protein